MPNARLQPLGIAEARNERRLFPVGCKPLFGGVSGHPVLRLFGETCLDKMLIECKGPLDTHLLHDNERDAIREGILLILMALEIGPPCVKECRIDMDKLHRGAL